MKGKNLLGHIRFVIYLFILRMRVITWGIDNIQLTLTCELFLVMNFWSYMGKKIAKTHYVLDMSLFMYCDLIGVWSIKDTHYNLLHIAKSD